MTVNEWNALIGLVGTSILGPLIAYAKSTANARAESEKIQAERLATAMKRDTDHQLLKQDVERLKERMRALEEMGVAINDIKTSVARIEAILPLLVEQFKKGNCAQ